MAFPPQHVLVATDLSEASRPALESAAFFGREHGAKLQLLHVFDPSPYVPTTMMAGASALLSQAAKEMRESFERALEERREELFPGMDVEIVTLRRDDPGAGIAEQAKAIGADLIIVGSHGRTGLKRVLLGSVAERVVRLAPCPVLVVRSAEAAEG